MLSNSIENDICFKIIRTKRQKVKYQIQNSSRIIEASYRRQPDCKSLKIRRLNKQLEYLLPRTLARG